MEPVPLEYLFWGLCGLVAYVYAGYPLAVALAARWRPRAHVPRPSVPPRVTLLFCVHNERPVLHEKLANCRALDYPRDRLEIIAGSDGSTDGSAEMLAEHERRGEVRAFVQAHRTGKTGLLNRAVETASGEILLFTDASTHLEPDAIWDHVRHYQDPAIGCVGGDLKFINTARASMSAGHGLYWRYESWIRRSESALAILAYVPGANYSMRRPLWRPVPPEFADDCVSPLNVVDQGQRVVYDPDVVAREIATETLRGLFARRVRMVTRDLEATLQYGRLLNPLRHGGVAISLFSHKLLRWMVPLALAALLPVTVALARRPLYGGMLVGQGLFYALAVVASLRGDRAPRNRLLSFPLYFCVSNLGALRGLFNVALRRRIGIWNPVGAR